MKFSVVTPTFNRAELLERCYESLRRQDFADFEWVVVDDGSTDNTNELVDAWRSVSPFPLVLISQTNGGKHRALNAASARTRGEYTWVLDSDDVMADGALARVADLLESWIGPAPGGVIANCHRLDDRNVIGAKMPDYPGSLTTGREIRERWGVRGDTARIYRSDLLRRFPLPEFPNERFAPENIQYDAIDAKDRLLVTQETLLLCEYQSSGLSAGIDLHRARSPRGFACGLESTAWVSKQPARVIEYTLKYQVWHRAFLRGYGWRGFRRRGYFLMCAPVAFLLYLARRPTFIFRARNLIDENSVHPASRRR